MPATIPAEQEMLGYMKSLSNWGRWGAGDRIGCLNYITPDKRKRALALVQDGVTLSLSRTVRFESMPDQPAPPIHYMVSSGEGFATGDRLFDRLAQTSSDFFGMIFHGHSITHLDSLCHFFWEGKMYNGLDAKLVSTRLGATEGAVDLVKDGIVTRAVLVDVPLVRGVDWIDRGQGVMPEDILAAEERCGFTVEEGDVLLVRTGQLHRRGVQGAVDIAAEGSTALHGACLPLLHQRGVSVLGSDTGNDVQPPPYELMTNPIHQVGLVAMGMWILDNANLEDVAQKCQSRNRWEFLINILPLRLHNTTGSPVNPVALF